MVNFNLSQYDRIILFGYGLFETLLIIGNDAKFLKLHWNRMKNGAELLGLSLPDFTEWSRLIMDYLEQETDNTNSFALRITLTGGAPQSEIPNRILFHTRPIPYTETQYTNGIDLRLLKTIRNERSLLAGIKSTNYLENLLAKNEAQRQMADDGLWLNTKGFLAECTMSNIFFVKDDNLYTPNLSCGCLPGTIREVVLDLAKSHNIPFFEGEYTLQDLLNSDEVFVTNSLMGLMPVKKLDDFTFTISPLDSQRSITRCLMNAYNSLLFTTH